VGRLCRTFSVGWGVVAGAPAPGVRAATVRLRLRDATSRESSSIRWIKLAFSEAGETRSRGLWRDFTDPVRLLWCWVQVALSLAGKYGLNVGREQPGPYAAEEVVRYCRCEALEVPEKLRGHTISHLVQEDLTDVLFARCEQPPQQLRLQCFLRLSLRRGRNDVCHLRCLPLIKLRDDVIKFGPLHADDANSNCASACANQSACW
jgi:hypothetical protein